MSNVKEPESWFKGPKQAAWSYAQLGRHAHAAASIHHVNIPRLAVFANDRHESDSERRGTPIARVTRLTSAMPVSWPIQLWKGIGLDPLTRGARLAQRVAVQVS